MCSGPYPVVYLAFGILGIRTSSCAILANGGYPLVLPECTWYQGQWAEGPAFRKPVDAATLSLLPDAGHSAHILGWGGGWLESIKHPWIPVCLHPLCSPCMAHLSDWLSIVVRGEQNLEKTAAPVAKMSLKEWGSWDAPGKWNAALKEWVMHQSQLWLAALVQRTKKFKIMGISRGQRQERKDADQNITWRLLTMLFNRGYILMKWNILSLT